MRITESEASEFVDEVQLRPHLWFGRDRLWVRKEGTQNLLAVKFLNGQVDHLLDVHVVGLRGGTEQSAAERYVSLMLRRCTCYGRRLQIEEYLRCRCIPGAAQIARDLVEDVIPMPVAGSRCKADRKLSRYVQNLLKEKT